MRALLFTPVFLCLLSCNLVRKTAKDDLTDGYYQHRTSGGKQLVYLRLVADSIALYPAVGKGKSKQVSNPSSTNGFPLEAASPPGSSVLVANSFDLDVLTIPLKFRPGTGGVPPQLNTNLNGAIFLGYRTDRYVLHYRPQPVGSLRRHITHFGYSFGGFTGLGNTFISPTTTANNLAIEYDGIVWSKGFTAIIGVNNFTVGLSAGFDNLLDANGRLWVYEGRPWLGLAFGINLN